MENSELPKEDMLKARENLKKKLSQVQTEEKVVFVERKKQQCYYNEE